MSNVVFKETNALRKHYHIPDDRRYVISQGGARSGKTYSILQLLIIECLTNPNKNLIISIVAETFPVLKRGTIRDFKNIMIDIGIWNEDNWSKSENIYKLNGNIVEFFSVENQDKARGPSRDYLFINEANNVSYETAFHLISRTRRKIFIDFNPVGLFWAHLEIIDNPQYEGKFELIKTNFLDNEYLEQDIVDNMLARASKDPNYKRVYVDGEVGTAEGLIFNNFKLIDKIPDEVIESARKQWLGLDWGHTGDPTALNSIYILGNYKYPVEEIYIDERLYQKGLLNKQIAQVVKSNIEKKSYEVVADSSEPKSIDELMLYGLKIIGAKKPPGSVNFGIDLMLGADIYITKNSLNTIKEFRNYKWKVDKNKQQVKDSAGRPVPIDLWNHSIDGIRYCAFHANDEKFEYKDIPKPTLRDRKGMVPV